MSTSSPLDPRAALVVIDLQEGIVSLPTVHPVEQIINNAARLAHAFRAHGLPVVLVRTNFSADRGDFLSSPVDSAPPTVAPSPDFAVLRPELTQSPEDIVITKRQWDAFYGTELDLQLRRRHIPRSCSPASRPASESNPPRVKPSPTAARSRSLRTP